MENKPQNKTLQNNQEIKTEIVEQIKTNTTNNKNLLKVNEKNNLKENKKKALLQTFSVYALELKNLNDEIFKQTEKMERYLDYYTNYAFANNLWNFSEKYKTDITYLSILFERDHMAQTRKYSRMVEKIFLRNKKRALNILQENLKFEPSSFIIYKIKDIIEKIKNKKEYLNKIKLFSNSLIKYDEKYENLINISGIEETLNENNKDEIFIKEDILTQNEFEKENYKYFDFSNLKEITEKFNSIFKNEEKNEKGEFLKYYLKIFNMQIKSLNEISNIVEKMNHGYNSYYEENCWIIYDSISYNLKESLNELIDSSNELRKKYQIN